MGVREVGFSLIFFIHLIHLVSSSSQLHKTLPSEFMQEIKIDEKITRGGASGGKAPNIGENGGSASPNMQGGAAVIPAYAAGAANNNHHHQNNHNAGHCNLNRIKFPISLVIIWVYTLIQ